MTAVRAGTDTTGPASIPSAGGRRRALLHLRLRPGDLTLIAPAALWAVMAWHRRWITDDGLIAARTVRQILAGHGPVFNSGERVEANTSALWTWLTAGLAWVTRLDVYPVLMLTGLVLAPAGLLLAQLGTRRMLRAAGHPGPLLPLGAAAVAGLPPFWDFATSGLESSLVFAWLGLCWWLLAGWKQGRLAGRAAVFGLGWVVRPDMLLASLGFLAVLFAVTRPGRRRAVGLLSASAAVPVAYEIFRMGYYGLLVPNTALTKEASASDLGQGLTYLGDYAGPYALWLPTLLIAAYVAAAQPWRRMSRAATLVWSSAFVIGFTLGLYVVYIGGDFMHARMLLPATFALLLPVMCVPLPRADGVRTVTALTALGGAGVWALTCAVYLRHEKVSFYIPDNGIVDERAYWVLRTGDANPTDAAPYLQMLTGSSDPAEGMRDLLGSAQFPAGKRGLYVLDSTGKYVGVPLTRPGTVALPGELLGTLGALVPLDGIAVDDHGLSYAVGSHLAENGTRPGHRKTTPVTWFLADYSAVHNDEVAGAGAVDAARVDLSCGALGELQRATRGPLGFGKFWANVADAYSMTTFRLPDDPSLAQDQLCP